MLFRSAYPAAQEAAQRAIELSPEIAESHVSLGLVRLFYDWDLAAARSCLERAIELNPGSAEARHWAGYCYMASGHFDEFLETAQVAASLDPLSPWALDSLGSAHLQAGSPREGLIHYDRALEIDPTFRTAIEGRALAYDRLGEHDRAIEEFLRYRALTPGGVGGLGTGVGIFARAGRTEEALGYLAELEELERTSPELTLHFDFIGVLSTLGRIDEAFERLERAIEARVSYVAFVRHNDFWEELHGDPRLYWTRGPGGTTAGPTTPAVQLAGLIAPAKPRPRFGREFTMPIIYAGNQKAAPLIEEVFDDTVDLSVVENLRPVLERENLGPARDAIHDLFLEPNL